jgi:hypothetical protein
MRSGFWMFLGAIALAGCKTDPNQVTGTAVTADGITIASAGGYEARIMAALKLAGGDDVTEEAAKVITLNKGGVRSDVPAKVKGLAVGLEHSGLFDDAEVKTALMGLDENAVATLLFDQGVRTVILSNEISPSVDRGSQVLSRLYHHDHLSRFQLFYVSDGLLYYRVRKNPVAFDPKLAAASMSYVRRRLQGGPPTALPDIKSETGNWTFVATLRGQGKELAMAFAQDRTLQGALNELVEDLEKVHRRRVEYFGFPPLKNHMKGLRLELQRVTERTSIEPRSEEFLQRYFEMGIDGAFIMRRVGKKLERGFLPGSVSYTQSIRSTDKFLREAAKQGLMSERRPWRGEGSTLHSFRTIHYMEAGPGKLVQLYRGATIVPMRAVTLESVRKGIVDAGQWYMNNLQPNGQVVYKFWPSENRYSNEYNHVRHTLATWNLVQAYEMDPSREDFLEGSKAALEWTNKYLRYEDNEQVGEMAFYSFKNNQKLGSVVVNLLGMIDLARATDDHQWDELLIKMGNFTRFMQDPNGKFRGYYVDEGHSYYGQTNDIVPGEAALALVFLAEYFDDDKWLEPLPKYWEYYKPWFRERASKGNQNAPWPAHTYTNEKRLELVQFGPWTVMAANAYHRRTGDQEVAEFGLEIARWMIETYQWSEERTPWPDYVGGYFKMPGELPAMQAFCYAEGTAAAYDLALRAKPEEAAYFEKSTREAMRLGLLMQYNELDVYAFSRPKQVFGGIRYALNETKVRIDYVHHGLSAMYQYYKAGLTDSSLPDYMRAKPTKGAAEANEG